MAVCISMMNGRFGTFVASNTVGFLLEQNCNFTFIIFVVIVYGETSSCLVFCFLFFSFILIFSLRISELLTTLEIMYQHLMTKGTKSIDSFEFDME
jgi:hypothetical protein